MTLFRSIKGQSPSYGKDCWFAETATIIGEVSMGDQCTVWYNAVIRGDVNSIVIGHKVNIQDGVVIHGTYKTGPTKIGNKVSIGHRAIVHGCTIEDHVLIGMGAIVMDQAIIKEGAIIAAGAVVSAGTVVGSGEVFAGVPAKKIKNASQENKEMIARIADNYPMYAGWYKE